MIELRGLTKRYGTFEAVNGIDLHVPTGELFGFLGPNGGIATVVWTALFLAVALWRLAARSSRPTCQPITIFD